MTGAKMVVSFEGSAKHCFHTTGWVLSFEENGKPTFLPLHWYPHWRGKLLRCPQTVARKLWE